MELPKWDYGVPWENRHSLEPLRTYCGKVVHKRKKHFFNFQDANRIIEKLGFVYDPEDPTAIVPRSFAGRLIAWVWRLIFDIAPVPGVLVPYETPFIQWYVNILEDCYSNDFPGRSKIHTQDFILQILEIWQSNYGPIKGGT